jgi:hypothetical protein
MSCHWLCILLCMLLPVCQLHSLLLKYPTRSNFYLPDCLMNFEIRNKKKKTKTQFCFFHFLNLPVIHQSALLILLHADFKSFTACCLLIKHLVPKPKTSTKCLECVLPNQICKVYSYIVLSYLFTAFDWLWNVASHFELRRHNSWEKKVFNKMSRHMKLKEMVNEMHHTKWKSDLSQQVPSQ